MSGTHEGLMKAWATRRGEGSADDKKVQTKSGPMHQQSALAYAAAK